MAGLLSYLESLMDSWGNLESFLPVNVDTDLSGTGVSVIFFPYGVHNSVP